MITSHYHLVHKKQNLSVYLSIYLSTYLPTNMYLSIYLHNYLSIYLSIYLSFYLSVSLSIYLSIHLSFSFFIQLGQVLIPLESTWRIILEFTPKLKMNLVDPIVLQQICHWWMRGGWRDCGGVCTSRNHNVRPVNK